MRALVVLAVATLFLAGCTSEQPTEKTSSPTTTTTTKTQCTVNCGGQGGVDYEDEKPVFNPYHQHNLWEGRTEVWLFKEYAIVLNEDADDVRKELNPNGNTFYSGRRCFRFADDSTYTATSSDGADVVFQGTKYLEYKINWEPQTTRGEHIPGLSFSYKAADAAFHVAVENVPKNELSRIDIHPGMSDMAHSSQVSRWEFCIWAHDPTVQEGAPVRAMVVRGTAKITMKAYYGGVDSIDEPHPFWYVDVKERHVGEFNKTNIDGTEIYVQDQIENSEPIKNGRELFGFFTDDKKIIPWDTDLLRVYFFYNYTDSAPPAGITRTVKLLYMDATGHVKALTPKRTLATYTQGQGLYYEIVLRETTAADDPYAQETDWRWGIKPVINDDEDRGGQFKGDLHLLLIGEGDDTEAIQR